MTVAPGGSNPDQNPINIYSTSFNNSFIYHAGTSMATPHVSGIVGLLDFYRQMPALEDNLREVLTRTATDFGNPGYDDIFGYGEVNAMAALDFIGPPHRVHTCDATFGQGPFVESVSDEEWYAFTGNRYIGNGIYRVKCYEVRYIAYYYTNCPCLIDQPQTTPIVWGIDALSRGWSGENPNSGVNFCGVVSANNQSVTLKTYVYEFFDEYHHSQGFLPCPPEECEFSFTAVVDATPNAPRSVTAVPSNDYHPLISWHPSTSQDLIGYKVYRKVHGIEPNWVYIGNVMAPTCQYIDYQYSTPHTGPIGYWTDIAEYTVTAINDYAESSMPTPGTIRVVVPAYPEPPKPSKTATNTVMIPSEYSLSTAYPNPFNIQTTIGYSLPEAAFINLEIFDISGRKVATLMNETNNAGYHQCVWDASNLSSGIYYYRLKAGNFTDTKSITLLK